MQMLSCGSSPCTFSSAFVEDFKVRKPLKWLASEMALASVCTRKKTGTPSPFGKGERLVCFDVNVSLSLSLSLSPLLSFAAALRKGRKIGVFCCECALARSLALSLALSLSLSLARGNP